MSLRLRLATAALCCLPIAALSSAQTPLPAPSNTPVDPTKSLDAQLSPVEKEVVGLADAMPADKYSFAPANTDFAGALKPDYTGVRTFGQEVAHIATANYLYGALFSGLKPQVADMQAIGKATDKEAALANLKSSFAFLHQAVATVTKDNAFTHAGRGADDSRISLYAAVLAHNRDHYGQLVEYLRMNGITPPASQGRPPANPAQK